MYLYKTLKAFQELKSGDYYKMSKTENSNWNIIYFLFLKLQIQVWGPQPLKKMIINQSIQMSEDMDSRKSTSSIFFMLFCQKVRNQK